MDFQAQVRAFKAIEILLSDGHNFSNLPVSREDAYAIITGQAVPTAAALLALEREAALVATPVVDF